MYALLFSMPLVKQRYICFTNDSVSMSSFTKRSERAGRWVQQGSGETSYEAFIPAPLPPVPAITVDSVLQQRLEAAGLALSL